MTPQSNIGTWLLRIAWPLCVVMRCQFNPAVITLHYPYIVQDYIRAIFPSPNSSDLLVTASYDHSLRLWDVRRPEPTVLELSHGAPVEDVLVFPSGGTCVSCGSHWIRVWDLLAGGRMLLAFSNHQKTITSLCFDGSHERLLSGGLDK